MNATLNPQNDAVANIRTRHSPGTVDGTLARLVALASDRGLTVFATIDHARAAAVAGMHLPETKVVLLGRPESGTPVMLAVPLIALDLPMRILITEDPAGGCQLSYYPTDALAAFHHVDRSVLEPLNGIGALVSLVAEQQQDAPAES